MGGWISDVAAGALVGAPPSSCKERERERERKREREIESPSPHASPMRRQHAGCSTARQTAGSVHHAPNHISKCLEAALELRNNRTTVWLPFSNRRMTVLVGVSEGRVVCSVQSRLES